MKTKKELELEKRTNLVTIVNSLDKDKGGRRSWTDETRKTVIEFYDNRYKNIVIGMVISEDFITHTLNIHLNQIQNWKKMYKKKGKIGNIVRKQTIAPITPLKANSIAAKGRVIGTTLGSMLHGMKDNNIVEKITMVDTLKEAGYKEDEVLKKLEAPTLEEFKQIMKAVKLIEEDYTLTKKE